MRKRIFQVNELIKREIGQILQKEIELPAGFLVTVTRVESSANLQEANIYISVMPEEDSQRIFKILESQIYFLQQKLNKRLKMRPVPKIRFSREKMVSEANRVEEILEELKKEKK